MKGNAFCMQKTTCHYAAQRDVDGDVSITKARVCAMKCFVILNAFTGAKFSAMIGGDLMHIGVNTAVIKHL